MKKSLFIHLCIIFACYTEAMQISPRYVNAKIRLTAASSQTEESYQFDNFDSNLFSKFFHISDKIVSEEDKRKIMETQKNLNEDYLEILEPSQKIKFLDDQTEKERVSQIIDEIIERLNSDSLGIFTNKDDDGMFVVDTPIQELNDLCIMYDVNELSTLENIKSLKEFLSQYPDIGLYPDIKPLLELI